MKILAHLGHGGRRRTQLTRLGWAWNPGEGREPAPGNQEAAGQLVQAWIENWRAMSRLSMLSSMSGGQPLGYASLYRLLPAKHGV